MPDSSEDSERVPTSALSTERVKSTRPFAGPPSLSELDHSPEREESALS